MKATSAEQTESNVLVQDLDVRGDNAEAEFEDQMTSQFIVKKTEPSDIFFYMDSIERNEETAKDILEYNSFFEIDDIEVAYENSEFSVTILDQNDNNGIVGIFIFNSSPFTPIKRRNLPDYLVQNPGLWEKWFNINFDRPKLNGKNSLWLIYFVLTPKYKQDIQRLQKIFLKSHASFYTTLPKYSNVLFLLSKEQNAEINATGNDELQNEDNNENTLATSPVGDVVRLLLKYMYKPINEIAAQDRRDGSDPNANPFLTFCNNISDVIPIIEIRTGVEYDHDDLENIIKEQTPVDVMEQFEDFFIAKMIANQDKENKVLVGQVNDKAIGMLAISTDININHLINNFELEPYDNLLKQEYMEAVNLKRNQIVNAKRQNEAKELKDIKQQYHEEIMKCQRISQRLYLQKYINERADYIDKIDEIEKTATSKEEELTTKTAIDIINAVLEQYSIKYPELEKFEGKITISEGECMLSNEFDFFIETLEFFGLPKDYMKGNGHWDDWLEKEAKKKAQKEQFRKKLGQTSKAPRHRQNKKENDEPIKPNYFDFSPLGKAMRLLKDANITVRTFLRKIIKENKHLIAGFFVDENGDPSEKRCFDLMSLYKKLVQAKVEIPPMFADKIGPILLCFGGIPCTKRVVERMPESEIIAANIEKKEPKKKKVAKKKEVHEEEVKKEVKPIKVTIYEVSISDFFKAVNTTFEYDKLMYEMGEIKDPDFIKEYEEYMQEENNKYLKSLLIEKTEYQKVNEENIKAITEESEKYLVKYNEYLKDYKDETSSPPAPPEVLNAFCVKLFFIEQAFESRSTDFLMQAFDLFPDKDYLVLTQPHSFIENSLLESFIKVNKKVDSLYGEVLYIIHRESLMISLLTVNYADEKDLQKASYLFEQLNGESDLMYQMALHAIRNKATSKFICVVCKINQHIVGICLLSKEVNIDYYDSHFSIRDYINLNKISKYFHSRIVFFASHKNFTQHTKTFMKEILRLINKICLYYEISPDVETCPKFFKDFILARNRKFPHFIMKKWEYERELYEDEKIKTRLDGEERDDLDEKESDFCLVYLSKKMMSETRIANNNRIVIVGGSDTGISFIETLLSIKYLEFSYIYLVAPGGLLYHHIENEINNLKVSINNYQIKDLKKLLLEQRIKIINSKVIDIKPKQKYIQFEDFSIMNYDYLILTLGLQDHLWKDLKLVCDKNLDEKFTDFRESQDKIDNPNPKEIAANLAALSNIQQSLKNSIGDMIYTIDDPKIYEKFAISDKKVISLRKNPKYEILLYGRNLNLICFIQGLIKRRVPPKKIKLVIPNIHFDLTVNKQKEEKRAYAKKTDKNAQDTLNLDDNLEFVNGNSLEDCKEVETFLIKMLKDTGVQVYENFNFAGVKLKCEEFADPANIKQELNDLVIESFKFVEDGKDNPVFLTTNLIVTGGMLDVDPIVFKFIHENGLVYNGRAIIGNNFLTADSNIFAAGKLCEFSQCYAYIEKYRQLKLESYNSQEVGYTLAKYFLQTADNQLNVDNSAFDDKKLPTFYLPLPIGCYLPNDYIFYKAKSVKETNPKIYMQQQNREPLVYNTLDKENGCLLKFNFNVFGIIDTVVYLGKENIDYRALISLVGLHETYLNNLLKRFKSNLVENIPLFLSENWALATYHDNFSKLIIKLKHILRESDILAIVSEVVKNEKELNRKEIDELLGKVEKKTRQKIEYQIVSFLKENKNQLPFYHLPELNPIDN